MKQEMKKISTLSYHNIEVNYFCNDEGYAAFYTEARSNSLLIDISDRKTGEIIRLHRNRVDIGINNEKIQTFHTNNHTGKATFGTASWEIDYELKNDKTVYTVRYYVESQ